MAGKSLQEKKTGGILGTIERVGNALPSPFILFLWLVVILVALTTVLAAFHVSAVNPTTGESVAVQSLLTRDGLEWILGSLVSNFSGFAALGIVLVMQMAIGVTEASGLLTTGIRRAVLGVPTWALTATVIFIGINGSIASEASIVFIPTLAPTPSTWGCTGCIPAASASPPTRSPTASTPFCGSSWSGTTSRAG